MTHSSIYKLAYHRTHAPVSSLKDAKGLKTFVSASGERAWLPGKRDVIFKTNHSIPGPPLHAPVKIHPGDRVRVMRQGDADTPSVIRVTSN